MRPVGHLDRGINNVKDYQPGGSSGFGTSNSDPLSNGTDCLRDAALMQELGVCT